LNVARTIDASSTVFQPAVNNVTLESPEAAKAQGGNLASTRHCLDPLGSQLDPVSDFLRGQELVCHGASFPPAYRGGRDEPMRRSALYAWR
jgi:hypothetical protein